MKGDLQENPTEQPIRVIGTESPSSPRATRIEDPERFLGTSRDEQYSNQHDVIRGIGPSVKEPTAHAHAPTPKEDKKKSKWGKPSWSDIFRVDGPPLQSYQRGINAKEVQHEAATEKSLQDRLDDEKFQREMKKKGGVDWGGKGVW